MISSMDSSMESGHGLKHGLQSMDSSISSSMDCSMVSSMDILVQQMISSMDSSMDTMDTILIHHKLSKSIQILHGAKRSSRVIAFKMNSIQSTLKNEITKVWKQVTYKMLTSIKQVSLAFSRLVWLNNSNFNSNLHAGTDGKYLPSQHWSFWKSKVLKIQHYKDSDTRQNWDIYVLESWGHSKKNFESISKPFWKKPIPRLYLAYSGILGLTLIYPSLDWLTLVYLSMIMNAFT